MAGRYKVAKKEDRTWQGIVFASRHEMDCYIQFQAVERSGGIAKLERQVWFPLLAWSPSGPPVPVSNYVADFVITEKDGTKRIYDAKGHRTAEYKRSFKWFHVNYPHLRIVEL